ncbi:MAG: Rrf2 family transcriptional regulator [Bryobacterales bacterium]|nr:Rrf2 family transcriptional regulator [Bryobacterales bacterium]
MKTLSRKAQYGLRALYALTRNYGRGPMLIATLSEQESIPKKFLEAILLELRNRGLVDSKKGRGGGYALAQPPEKIMLGTVVRIIDGPLAPLPCASETAYRRCDECPDERLCETRLVMKQVRDATARILDTTSLAQVCREIDELKEKETGQPALMYYI